MTLGWGIFGGLRYVRIRRNRASFGLHGEKERFELAVRFCASLEAERRVLFGPLEWNFDSAAERLARKICRMTTLRDGLDNRR